MTLIYALYSGRDGAVRYVGQTTNTLEQRFQQHRRGSYEHGLGVAGHWMRREWWHGYPVRIVQLEWCEYAQANEREYYWMNLFDDLLNTRNYYRPRWAPMYRKPTPKILDIKRYMSNYIFNVEGRRGIHWRRDIDMYFVLVASGGDFHYLDGDELPGGSSAIWFSDLARAEDARDRYRGFSRYQDWLPDIAA